MRSQVRSSGGGAGARTRYRATRCTIQERSERGTPPHSGLPPPRPVPSTDNSPRLAPHAQGDPVAGEEGTHLQSSGTEEALSGHSSGHLLLRLPRQPHRPPGYHGDRPISLWRHRSHGGRLPRPTALHGRRGKGGGGTEAEGRGRGLAHLPAPPAEDRGHPSLETTAESVPGWFHHGSQLLPELRRQSSGPSCSAKPSLPDPPGECASAGRPRGWHHPPLHPPQHLPHGGAGGTLPPITATWRQVSGWGALPLGDGPRPGSAPVGRTATLPQFTHQGARDGALCPRPEGAPAPTPPHGAAPGILPQDGPEIHSHLSPELHVGGEGQQGRPLPGASQTG
ncbi:uncharacterized protein [Scyliorhinus torazame]|uniref:uncharacterized protein n=1 Tax=Scyliorhinus torazame TaxID=75743 RepID=UPI003B5BCBC9